MTFTSVCIGKFGSISSVELNGWKSLSLDLPSNIKTLHIYSLQLSDVQLHRRGKKIMISKNL